MLKECIDVKQNFMLQVCNRKSYKTDMWNYRRLYERPPNKGTRKTWTKARAT